ncbi:hypothetical protein CEV32_4022 [Brucella rhizosphaerae]|uniref:Uncharacterized protein n=1 Tax=Brucella rhizosphaerae TaxID=571254 RepID=A0A256FR51_9HYPH|nr:hypothetical protein CEV32_4022 [Brucella rhizosphaerae]
MADNSEEFAVPLFNEASRIYAPDEIDFMRNCVALASLKLSGPQLDEAVLAEQVLRLYESGLRDSSVVCDLAIRLISPAQQSQDVFAANGNAAQEPDMLPE